MAFEKVVLSIDGIQKIGVVTSRFNEPVTSKMQEGALAALREAGLPESKIVNVEVPGAYEIPLAAKALLEQGCDGVVAVGAVIEGDTAHFDYVCNSVERGCTQLQLEYMKPVGFGVITTRNAEQAFDRAGGKKGNKGQEAAEVVLEMIQLINKLKKND
ncbi:MAG: 6,7-dimethyl-8-ribityllumazine synthase [Bdellovibrionales bacterium]